MPARLAGAAVVMASVSHTAFPRMQDSNWRSVGGLPWLIRGLRRKMLGSQRHHDSLGRERRASEGKL